MYTGVYKFKRTYRQSVEKGEMWSYFPCKVNNTAHATAKQSDGEEPEEGP